LLFFFFFSRDEQRSKKEKKSKPSSLCLDIFSLFVIQQRSRTQRERSVCLLFFSRDARALFFTLFSRKQQCVSAEEE